MHCVAFVCVHLSSCISFVCVFGDSLLFIPPSSLSLPPFPPLSLCVCMTSHQGRAGLQNEFCVRVVGARRAHPRPRPSLPPSLTHPLSLCSSLPSLCLPLLGSPPCLTAARPVLLLCEDAVISLRTLQMSCSSHSPLSDVGPPGSLAADLATRYAVTPPCVGGVGGAQDLGKEGRGGGAPLVPLSSRPLVPRGP